MIHDLVREVIVHELRERNLERHLTLIRLAAAHRFDGLEGAGQSAALQAIGEMIYTLRHEPYVKRQFPFGDVQCYPDSTSAGEIPALQAEVARLKGDESAAWFEYWLDREGTELLVLRDSTRQPCALAVNLLFDASDLAAGSDDPCVQALFRYLGRHAPLRGPEQVMLTRFMLAHGTHQARTPVWAELAAQLNGLMFTPGIVLLGWASDLAYDWSHISDTADARILPDTEYAIGGRSDPDSLRSLIQATSARQLVASPRPCSLHEALEQVYFVPAGKHPAAAVNAHVSERTLRRRLRAAESRLAEVLWQFETHTD